MQFMNILLTSTTKHSKTWELSFQIIKQWRRKIDPSPTMVLQYNPSHDVSNYVNILLKLSESQCSPTQLGKSHYKVNTSLGGTTRNVTPWFYWTHQTLKNHNFFLNFKKIIRNTFIRFIFNNIEKIFYFDVHNHSI
jgi:hypothetical protein